MGRAAAAAAAVLALVFEEQHRLEVHVGPRMPRFVPATVREHSEFIDNKVIYGDLTRSSRAPSPPRNTAKRPAPTAR